MPDKFGDRVRLLHIYDAIESILSYTEGMGFNDFSSDAMCFDACIRQLSIIGEASNYLSDPLYANNSQVSWPEIIALRNLVIHEYFGVDALIIWKIIDEDIPALKMQVRLILDGLKG